MKKLLLFTCLLLVFASSDAAAHVLIKDKTGTKGAILHIRPDDDPVAGEPATLYFDTQNLQDSKVSVGIRSTRTGKIDRVAPVAMDGSLATLQYIFPTQGAYELIFTVSGENTYTFTKYQRVTRGVSVDSSTSSIYVWSEMLFIASGVGLIVLLATFVNRCKEIAANSK